MPALTIRALQPDDWPAVEAIYAAGIATGDATFETRPPTWDDFDRTHLDDHRLVATHGHQIVGWVAASPVSDRCAYAGVVEHSIYIDPAHQGQGAGRVLLRAFITSTEGAGIWTIQSGIFPENTASLALHHSCGFRTIGHRERIGRHNGHWRDVILLERRSPTIGTPTE